MSTHPFSQVDVFASGPVSGNPVAVVHDAEGLTEEQMAAFANWTNLSETTFLLPPTTPDADYRLRIFTPGDELPFAGHPTLGSAHAWLAAGGTPQTAGTIVQECGIGLVNIAAEEGLAFEAPGFLRTGPVDPVDLDLALAALRLNREQVVSSYWIDNGPGWMGLVLTDADAVLAVRPDLAVFGDLKLGLIGAYDESTARSIGADYEVRAFCPGLGVVEDPVTGSLNAGFAVWLIESGQAPRDYTVRQGTALGRAGRVRISTDDQGVIRVGGECRTVISGSVACS